MNKQRNLKIAKLLYAIEYLGRYCKCCGFDGFEEPWFMDFHHINKNTKEFEVKNKVMNGVFKNFKNEIDKCELLCGRCHRKKHSYYNDFKENKEFIYSRLNELRESGGIINICRKFTFEEIENIIKMNEDGSSLKEISKKTGIEYYSVRNQLRKANKFIKNDRNKRNINIDEIIKLYNENNSLRSIGKIFGVSYMTIGNRLRKSGYDIKTGWDRIGKNEDEIIKYYNKGIPIYKVSNICKVSQFVVKNVLIKNNIKIRNSHSKLIDVDIEILNELKKLGLSYKEIAKRYNVSTNAIRTKMHLNL